MFFNKRKKKRIYNMIHDNTYLPKEYVISMGELPMQMYLSEANTPFSSSNSDVKKDYNPPLMKIDYNYSNDSYEIYSPMLEGNKYVISAFLPDVEVKKELYDWTYNIYSLYVSNYGFITQYLSEMHNYLLSVGYKIDSFTDNDVVYTFNTNAWEYTSVKVSFKYKNVSVLVEKGSSDTGAEFSFEEAKEGAVINFLNQSESNKENKEEATSMNQELYGDNKLELLFDAMFNKAKELALYSNTWTVRGVMDRRYKDTDAQQHTFCIWSEDRDVLQVDLRDAYKGGYTRREGKITVSYDAGQGEKHTVSVSETDYEKRVQYYNSLFLTILKTA